MLDKENPQTRLVYSTNAEDMIKVSETEKKIEYPAFGEQKLHLYLDRKGRKGKTMSIVEGLQALESDRQQWLKKLKKVCGAGGSLTSDGLQIQGEHLPKISEFFTKLGFQVRSSK